MNVRINDGSYHVVRFLRTGANSTLQIDDFQTQRKYKMGQQLHVFNKQNLLQIGGKFNPTLKKVDRPFVGVLAGLVINSLRPLDLAADRNVLTNINGDVKKLESIPFNYRERHPRLFDMSLTSYQMQQTNPSSLPEPGINDDLIVFGRAKCSSDDERYYDPQCFTYEGSGDELITPVYTPPPRPKWEKESIYNGANICDDDEDCREAGSGAYPDGKFF